MTTIWKYTLQIAGEQVLQVPAGSVPLTAQLQFGLLQLWVQIKDPSARRSDMRIGIYGTGNPMPDEPGRYLSTFQLDGGALVFHVFVLP